MSFVAILAALGMAWWSFTAISLANTSAGLLLAIFAVAPCVLDVVLGCWGIGAANKPALSCGTYYVAATWLAVVVNVAAVVVYVLIGSMAVPSIINLVMVAVYLYFSRKVRIAALG